MISEFSRFVYVGQFHLYTFRNYFPNHVPTAETLFSALAVKERAKLTITKKLQMEISFKKIEVDSANGFVTLLFQVIDPSIPDHVVVDLSKRTHRTNFREPNEAPIITAHAVVNVASKFVASGTYPAVLENSDFLPRSYMVEHINAALANHFTAPKIIPAKGGKKAVTRDFSPRINFGASAQTTVAAVLASGGALKGVKWVEQSVENGTTGDGAYPQTERRDVYMNVGNRPSGGAATKILQKIAASIPFSKAKKVSVILEDGYGRPKVVGLTSNSQDVLGAVFIPQEQVTLPMDNPLSIYQDVVHSEFVSGLKALAK